MADYNYGHASEFCYGWRGTCTQTSLSGILCAATRSDTSTANIQAYMNNLTRDMISRGWAATNGACTVWDVAREAEEVTGGKNSQIIYYERDYLNSQPVLPVSLWRDDPHVGLLNVAGKKPVLLQVANGQALVDAVTGARDEAGLRYHAIAVYDKCISGYICGDPDNPQANVRNQIYTWATLANAQPCGMLILNPKAVPAPTPPAPVVPPPAPITPPPAPAEDPYKLALEKIAAAIQTALAA